MYTRPLADELDIKIQNFKLCMAASIFGYKYYNRIDYQECAPRKRMLVCPPNKTASWRMIPHPSSTFRGYFIWQITVYSKLEVKDHGLRSSEYAKLYADLSAVILPTKV